MPTVNLLVVSEGHPIPAVDVVGTVFTTSGQGQVESTTDQAGKASLRIPPKCVIQQIQLVPLAGYWGKTIHDPNISEPKDISVELTALPPLQRTMWWHQATGTHRKVQAGGGISIGVVDTGCGPHPDLADVRLGGSIIGMRHNPEPAATIDKNRHGTHVTGIIASRPVGDGVTGMAADATTIALRVFPYAGNSQTESFADQGDIAEAIQYLSESRACDLINLSLGAAQRSMILEDAIEDAGDHGTLCIAAAGNTGRITGAVEYPARFGNVVAIGAVGKLGWAPIDSSSHEALSVHASEDGYTIANFSPDSSDVNAIAPGVGIISTVPNEGLASYGVMDGTSMATPAAVAVLANLLSQSEEYLSLGRDRKRFTFARDTFISRCRDLGFPARRQGHGLVTINT